ncbi:hypothetical protein CXF67_08005 [Psychroflexus sp. MES1-P1E]|nr:hypothetical protein CXF67_08005 [Psychroflexus sp. MES1-P1E]
MTINTNAQNLNREKIAEYEIALDDVMEIIGRDLVKSKLKEVEKVYQDNPTEINKVRLGLIYHEVALNLTFFHKTEEFSGYAQKSFNILKELQNNKKTIPELLLFIDTYKASALALMSGETRKLKQLSEAFDLFEGAVEKYAKFSPRPEFMRGSVAENLPWFMWKKRKFAKRDFQSIIEKHERNKDYAGFRLLSFTYWGWARAHKAKSFRKQALIYLERAIKIDPEYNAGRKRAEELRSEYLYKKIKS